MAKDVASRVSGDEASAAELRERAERAAALIPSIHERWPAPASAPAATLPSRPHTEADAGEEASTEHASESDAEPTSVSVTPILGIATESDADSSARPRFKTLMGVPRTDPEIDELAGLDPALPRPHDTQRLERPTLRSPSAPEPEAEAPAFVTREEPSLAATSWPWDRSASLGVAPRAVEPQWSALVENSLDVSAEVAAMRTARTRRPWLITLAALIGAVALFSVAAPRERTLALRWLRREYDARVHPAVDAVTDRARALRPADVVDPAIVAPEPAAPLGTAALSAKLAPTASSTLRPAEPAPAATTPPSAAPAEVASVNGTTQPKTTTARALASGDAARPKRGAATPEAKASPSVPSRDTKTAVNTPVNTAAKPRAQVAAPRKRAVPPTPAVANTTKPRATRQNPPRKDTGGGIIRETPF